MLVIHKGSGKWRGDSIVCHSVIALLARWVDWYSGKSKKVVFEDVYSVHFQVEYLVWATTLASVNFNKYWSFACKHNFNMKASRVKPKSTNTVYSVVFKRCNFFLCESGRHLGSGFQVVWSNAWPVVNNLDVFSFAVPHKTVHIKLVTDQALFYKNSAFVTARVPFKHSILCQVCRDCVECFGCFFHGISAKNSTTSSSTGWFKNTWESNSFNSLCKLFFRFCNTRSRGSKSSCSSCDTSQVLASCISVCLCWVSVKSQSSCNLSNQSDTVLIWGEYNIKSNTSLCCCFHDVVTSILATKVSKKCLVKNLSLLHNLVKGVLFSFETSPKFNPVIHNPLSGRCHLVTHSWDTWRSDPNAFLPLQRFKAGLLGLLGWRVGHDQFCSRSHS
mmetsp:Transcript_34731/g.55652  ORF Transcript_34731/g.55652 Transcript_34731/m.55652 type:complete len:388 (-) Transcript_34731:1794-2957(-)